MRIFGLMINQLESIINDYESKIPQFEKSNPGVSASNVGWHIEHVLLTTNGIIKRLSNTNPADYQWKFNIKKLLVFSMGKILRGKAKAPKHVAPKEDYTLESLNEHLLETRKNLVILEQIDTNQFFEHPYFGHLKKKQSIYFLEIHSKHHLDIINEIIK
jgi:hypothetical protein